MEQEQQDLRLFDLARRQLDVYPNLSIFDHKINNEWKEVKTS